MCRLVVFVMPPRHISSRLQSLSTMSLCFISLAFSVAREKGRDLTQFCDKNPYTHRTIQKATWQHKNATKNFDYTTIADRLRTVSWSNARQHKSCINMHIVQHLMSSKGEKRWIWDDFTCFPKYSWQMTIARSEDINKEGTSILNLLKNPIDN